ncbi:ABC transporter substrate-binding protein [Tepidibacter formicigenes]|jgi:putative spermidine/putrescine transport system substrate-binding protein|uniref:Putative spermidine/putrescine transport system substrate-binding protein n=1 Tax=Tepidibacter formicigenes DSM 15518 TaxID=1123349 RepID=A0A1M6PZQ3_9FIRM|nr:ABC transporter substrate-binding protein [Tepidibacter formicigenes]SHK13346.1 putative spermidine/putrescine transport system substrate-binding protein [Tepidibacter formicigenes DSM 15518]
MKKIAWILVILLISISIISGCSKKEEKESINILDLKWEDIVSQSKGQEVNIYMWGGDKSVNSYIDDWAKPLIKKKFNISLNRVPINDPKDMINKLLTEKEVDKKQGSIDILWINGENFKTSKDNNLLWASFADKLPNYNKYVDKDSLDIKYDFGEDTMGMEVPWGKSQFVFIYDSEKVKNPPKDMKEFKEWIKENPGKFTYPSPPDFTGSAFIRQTFVHLIGEYKGYDTVDMNKFKSDSNITWDYMKEIKPYLWRKGKTYPESSSKLDMLYANGEVLMSMSYNPLHAFNKIKNGEFKESTNVFFLNDGTLSNTHYLTIPFNASNKEGAMVVINFLLSPNAQITKFNPSYWGDGLVISYDKLSNSDKEKLSSIYGLKETKFLEKLQKHKIPEMKSKYVEEIEKDWMENVAKD